MCETAGLGTADEVLTPMCFLSTPQFSFTALLDMYIYIYTYICAYLVSIFPSRLQTMRAETVLITINS